ncbi:MAG: sulfite exporter TauE/SafE family protein [Alphaproteobacteria bacterium]|nr:sulfite exporter TauE/SafE family protein [Alphaproteobacteria bacterium]
MDSATLSALLQSGLSYCHTAISTDGGLMASLLLTGLVGGLTHCSGMCGPFALSQMAERMKSCPAMQMREWHRLSMALLLPYHLGRMTTYGLLGAGAALLAGSIGAATGLRWLSAALLILAALLFLGYAVPRLGLIKAGNGDSALFRRLSVFAKPLFAAPTGWRGYALGLILGYIPCGLVWGALSAAAASGSALSGAMAMMGFAAGTVPGLVLVAGLGQLASQRWGGLVQRVAPMLLLLNAGVLAVLAWRLIA